MRCQEPQNQGEVSLSICDTLLLVPCHYLTDHPPTTPARHGSDILLSVTDSIVPLKATHHLPQHRFPSNKQTPALQVEAWQSTCD